MSDDQPGAYEISTSPVEQLVTTLLAQHARADEITHRKILPGRLGQLATWPKWVDEQLIASLATKGISSPWQHQVQAAESIWSGQHTILSTGTASGKSLAYHLPSLTWALTNGQPPTASTPWRPATVLYLAPTKALVADQLATIQALDLPQLKIASIDGDAGTADREWARKYARYLLTNPDMLHHSILPRHKEWSRFFRGLHVIIIDEAHYYRGILAANIALVIRRLRRICNFYGSHPLFFISSATISAPSTHALSLIGLPVQVIDQDFSQRASTEIYFWNTRKSEPQKPPLGNLTALSFLLAESVTANVPALAFMSSRRGVESATLKTKNVLSHRIPDYSHKVSSYRGGYLPEERRNLEKNWRSGSLTALIATSALELGVDLKGLDLVIISGWPGRLSSFWQQVGRAGRYGKKSIAIFLPNDDPLDAFLIDHPEAIFGKPIEATVFDPENPYVLAPQLAAAAAEIPLSQVDEEYFGPTITTVLEQLSQQKILRPRGEKWFWARPDRATDHIPLRGSGSGVISLVDSDTAQILGTVDAAAADHSMHAGAMYLHQGKQFEVQALNYEASIAWLQPSNHSWTTHAKSKTEIHITSLLKNTAWASLDINFGVVEVMSQVKTYQRRDLKTKKVIDERKLELPSRAFSTKALWLTAPLEFWLDSGVALSDLGGALHAAEHAMISLLPIYASCDRWDIGGMSTVQHPKTMQPTIFIYDGLPGGAGLAERGYWVLEDWLRSVRSLIENCPCIMGCPACIQSPKCGNGNEPLAKAGALSVLKHILSIPPEFYGII